MGYRIGSFNVQRLGNGATNEKINGICKIIREEKLDIDSEYTNENVNMAELINLFEALTPDGEIKIHESFDPISFLGNIVKLPF